MVTNPSVTQLFALNIESCDANLTQSSAIVIKHIVILDQCILQHLRYARNANPIHPICASVSSVRVSQILSLKTLPRT
jgi:hypothetical protein